MKQSLVNKPNNYALREILVNFAGGVPLSADQLNFIYRHEKTLSQYGMDPAIKYYLKSHYKKSADHNSFLIHRENLDAKATAELRKRLELLLTEKPEAKQRIKVPITPRQFNEFKNSAVPSLIFFHGNQYLTGAPFYPGGIPHVVFFQWGNYFGIAKYVVLAEEKSLSSNILVYFENMHERNLEQCVKEATHDLRDELLPTHEVAHTQKLDMQTPQENYRPSVFQTPKLSLNTMADKSSK